jgi:hypothetical protein
MKSEKNNWTLRAVPAQGSQTVALTVSPQRPLLKNFFRAKDRRDVYVAFGPTAPTALRRLAEGMEAEGIRYVDAITITPERDASDGSNFTFSATAFANEIQD